MNCCIDQITKNLIDDYSELEIYTCGIDKGIRNCFVPLFQSPPFKEGDIDDFEIKISSSMQNAFIEHSSMKKTSQIVSLLSLTRELLQLWRSDIEAVQNASIHQQFRFCSEIIS